MDPTPDSQTNNPPPAAPPASNWREALSPELREAPALRDTKDINGLAKQFVDLQSHLGNSVRIPGPDASSEAIKAFHEKLTARVPGLYYMPNAEDQEAQQALWTKLGVPSKADEYEIPVPEGGQPLEVFKEWAAEAKLTKTQAKLLAEKWNSSIAQDAIEQENRRKTELQALEHEWGMAKEQKVNTIINFATKTGAPPELIEMARNGQIGANTLRWMDRVVNAMGHEPSAATHEVGSGQTLTPSEANLQINEIMARPEYWDSNSPMQQSLKDKVLKLAKMADPSASTELPRTSFGS